LHRVQVNWFRAGVEMTLRTPNRKLQWEDAKGLLPLADNELPLPQGALVPDVLHDQDQIAVVYDKGQHPPEITINRVSRSVQTVLADGVAVAVVARAMGPALLAEDVLLVERCR
jgi:hypothetical protein